MYVQADTPPPPFAIALALCAALKRAGVQFVHWKSNDHLAEALAGETDIDMFVRPGDRLVFEAAMKELGGLKIISQPWGRYPEIEDWLILDPETGKFLHIHLHYALMTGLKRVKHLRLPWSDSLLSHVRYDARSGWPIPTAEMELVILLVRIWAKMPPWRRVLSLRIPSHIRRELDWLRGSASPEDLGTLLGELFPAVDPAPVLRLLQAGPLGTRDVTDVARMLYSQLGANFRMPWAVALGLAAWRNSYMACAKALRMIRPEVRTGKTLVGPGLMIALVGSDGAGKSTLGKEITRWLRFKLDVHNYYMGSGDGGTHLIDWTRRAIRALVKAVNRKRSSGQPKLPKAGKSRSSSFGAKLVELYQLILMRHKIRMLRVGRRLADGGSLVLTDRYPQTQVAGICDGPKLQSGAGFVWAAAQEAGLYAQARSLGPDILLKLKISPAIAHQRKSDHDLSVIERKCRIIDELEFPQSKVVVIDAAAPFNEVLLAAKAAIWAHILGRKGP